MYSYIYTPVSRVLCNFELLLLLLSSLGMKYGRGGGRAEGGQGERGTWGRGGEETWIVPKAVSTHGTGTFRRQAHRHMHAGIPSKACRKYRLYRKSREISPRISWNIKPRLNFIREVHKQLKYNVTNIGNSIIILQHTCKCTQQKKKKKAGKYTDFTHMTFAQRNILSSLVCSLLPQ